MLVGAGPAGLTAAGLLGRLGYSVAVVERHPGLYNLPRAGHADHEIMRVVQLLGCAERFLTDAVACDSYTLRNGGGELLAEFPWSATGVSGWRSDYMMYQPVLGGCPLLERRTCGPGPGSRSRPGGCPCTLDPQEAEHRDEAFRNGAASHLSTVPPLTGIVRDDKGAGELGLQAPCAAATPKACSTTWWAAASP